MTPSDPPLIRLKRRLGPLLNVPAINGLRGVPMPDVTGDAAQCAIARMIHEGGRLIGRVGETEGRAVAFYLRHRMAQSEHALPYEPRNRHRLKSFAGFFPTGDDDIDVMARLYIEAIARIDLYAAWTPHDRLLCPRAALKCRLHDFDPFFTQQRWPLALAGKRVTVVSPFKKTILAQWAKREALFATPTLPDFDLSVVAAPLTQCEQDVAGQDWFDNLHRLDREVAATDPEVVIIGAGAYGLPIGAMTVARRTTAIVLGGPTQLLFGIMGNRWLIYPDYAALQNAAWVRPRPDERPAGYERMETAGGAYW